MRKITYVIGVLALASMTLTAQAQTANTRPEPQFPPLPQRDDSGRKFDDRNTRILPPAREDDSRGEREKPNPMRHQEELRALRMGTSSTGTTQSREMKNRPGYLGPPIRQDDDSKRGNGPRMGFGTSTTSTSPRKEEFRKELEVRKAQLRSTVEARHAELKQKLAEFKDQKKAEIASRVDSTLGMINEKRSAYFTETIDRIDGVLTKISSRADKAEAAGKDVGDVRSKIASASAAITAARTAITSQAGKDYTLTVSSDETVKTDAGASRDSLKADLEAVRTTVKSAYDAVKAAAQSLKSVAGTEQAEAPVPSTNQ